jgi:hypothetical protein
VPRGQISEVTHAPPPVHVAAAAGQKPHGPTPSSSCRLSSGRRACTRPHAAPLLDREVANPPSTFKSRGSSRAATARHGNHGDAARRSSGYRGRRLPDAVVILHALPADVPRWLHSSRKAAAQPSGRSRAATAGSFSEMSELQRGRTVNCFRRFKGVKPRYASPTKRPIL